MRGKTTLLLLAGASFCWADLITPLKIEGRADDPWNAFTPFVHKFTDPAPQSPGAYTNDFYSGAFSGARGYVDGNGPDPENDSFEQEDAGFSATGQKVTATNLPNPGVIPTCLSPFNCAYYGSAETGIRSNKAKAHVISDWEKGKTFSGAWADAQFSHSSSLWTEGFIFDALPGFGNGTTTFEVNLDGSWSGTGGFLYELGALYLDRGLYNPDGEDYPAVAMATGSYTPGIPLVRLFGVVKPEEEESGPPPIPETEGRSSIDRKLTFTFDWLPGERILVYSLLSTGASKREGYAAFESTALVTNFSISGGTIGTQLSDFDWSSLGQEGGDPGAGPGTPVPEPSGVLLIGGGLLAVAVFSRKRA